MGKTQPGRRISAAAGFSAPLGSRLCREGGKKGEGKKRHHSGQQATCHPHPTAHHPIQSHGLERREQRVHPALFCNSFREESNNLELPGKLMDKTLMKNLIPTSTLSSGLLLCYRHFLALLPLLSSCCILHMILCLPDFTIFSEGSLSSCSWEKSQQVSLVITVLLNKVFSVPEGKWYRGCGKSCAQTLSCLGTEWLCWNYLFGEEFWHDLSPARYSSLVWEGAH